MEIPSPFFFFFFIDVLGLYVFLDFAQTVLVLYIYIYILICIFFWIYEFDFLEVSMLIVLEFVVLRLILSGLVNWVCLDLEKNMKNEVLGWRFDDFYGLVFSCGFGFDDFFMFWMFQ